MHKYIRLFMFAFMLAFTLWFLSRSDNGKQNVLYNVQQEDPIFVSMGSLYVERGHSTSNDHNVAHIADDNATKLVLGETIKQEEQVKDRQRMDNNHINTDDGTQWKYENRMPVNRMKPQNISGFKDEDITLIDNTMTMDAVTKDTRYMEPW